MMRQKETTLPASSSLKQLSESVSSSKNGRRKKPRYLTRGTDASDGLNAERTSEGKNHNKNDDDNTSTDKSDDESKEKSIV